MTSYDEAMGLIRSCLRDIGSKNASGDEWLCPVHEGGMGKVHSPSLTVKRGTDPGQIVMKCAKCDTRQVLDALGLTFAALRFDQNTTPVKSGKPVRHNYPDEHGEDYLRVTRQRMTSGRPKITQHHRTGSGWESGVGGRERVLYNLPGVLTAVRKCRTVHLTEGESDADALNEWFTANKVKSFATCHPQGAGKWHLGDYTRSLAGAARVVVWADRDAPGYACAMQRFSALQGAVQTVELRLPLPVHEKADVRDHLQAGHTPDDGEVATLGEVGALATAATAAGKEPWPDPEPLDPPLPTPPLVKLPAVLRDFVEAVAAATSTPADLALLTSLAVLSAATRGAWKVAIYPGWEQTLAVYSNALSPSGTRKSAVMAMVTAPLLNYEREAIATHDREAPERAARYALAKRRTDDAMKAAKGGDADAEEDYLRLHAEAEALRPNTRPVLVVKDVTPEAFVVSAGEQGGVLSVFAAEGTFLANVAGRYSSQPNVESFNEAYEDETVDRTRISKDTVPVHIRHPFFVLGLSVQPETAAGLIKPQMDHNGFLGRFLFALPKSNLGHRDFSQETPVPLEVALAWANGVEGVLKAADEWISDGRSGDNWHRRLSLAPKAESRVRGSAARTGDSWG